MQGYTQRRIGECIRGDDLLPIEKLAWVGGAEGGSDAKLCVGVNLPIVRNSVATAHARRNDNFLT